MQILQSQNLSKTYIIGSKEVKALVDVSIEIERGEFISIVGKSGSGKSTLLNLLGGLDKQSDGKVIVDEEDLSKLNDEELTIFRRRKIGFVFQNYNLVPNLSVFENIILPTKLDNKKVDEVFLTEIINALGIEDKMNYLPGNLSGGEQQRVAIARALLSKPAIILADEPTGNLDSKTGLEVVALLKSLNKKFSQTIVMITHNEEIAQLSDRIIHIRDGKVFNRR